MAAPYTSLSTFTNIVKAAYDQNIRLALRSAPQFRAIADTKVIAPTNPGTSVVFNIHQDLAPVTSPLSDDTTDPAGVTLSNTTPVTVTLNEYGDYTVVTNFLQKTNLDNAFDANVASRISNQLVDSVDLIVRAVLDAGTNVITVEGGVVKDASTDVDNILATDTITAQAIRNAAVKLRAANVAPFDGVHYVCYIDPRVASDLRSETDAAGWRAYQNPSQGMDDGLDGIINGTITVFEGVAFVETPRVAKVANDGGIEVFNTYVVGKEALAEVVAQEFGVVYDGDITDPLGRKVTVGWYGIAGWNLFRPESLWLIKTAASIS